jgi:hypothetical protein
VKVDSSLAQAECRQNRSIEVLYQRCFVVHLDEVVEGEVAERIVASIRCSCRFRIFELDCFKQSSLL